MYSPLNPHFGHTKINFAEQQEIEGILISSETAGNDPGVELGEYFVQWAFEQYAYGVECFDGVKQRSFKATMADGHYSGGVTALAESRQRLIQAQKLGTEL